MTDGGVEALPDWDGQLAALYAALAAQGKGATSAEAEALLRRIAALLVEALETAYAQGCACRAARRDRAAFRNLTTALGLYRWTPPGLTPSISAAACYGALAALYRDWGQPNAVAAAMAKALGTARGFYTMTPLCQIPVLDGLYERLFGERAVGCFVEVGAFDGESYSNTAGLADLGWAGLYIEPVPEAFQQCCRRHANNPRVKVVNCAIGAVDGATSLYVAREFSTVSRAHVEHGIAQGWMPQGVYDQIVVTQQRLATALAQASIEPGFDLLVVDVEGAEEQVFAGFDVAHWRPRALIVELADFAPPGQAVEGDPPALAAAQRVRARILAAGYETIYADYNNTVFARRAG
jgi:FkbM family methyltransferase